MVILKKDYTLEWTKANPEYIVVFGDNLVGKGKRDGAGQAVIRDAHNSFGIPTKIAPCLRPNCFFSDKESEIVKVNSALDKLEELERDGFTIVLPHDGIGTGRAYLKTKSPIIYDIITSRLILLHPEYLKHIDT